MMGLESALFEPKKDADVFKICDLIRETGFSIHNFHRHGHLEKVYENALAHRLRKTGLRVEQQYSLSVYDEDGTPLGNYEADLFVENCLIVEVKACRTLIDDHTAQLLGYLRSSGIEHGLLINFGAARFQIKKFVLT
jgi:GxxExxY protein